MTTCISCQGQFDSGYKVYDWMKEDQCICDNCSGTILRKFLTNTAEGANLQLILLLQKGRAIQDNLAASIQAHKEAMQETFSEMEEMVDYIEAENQQLHQRAEDAQLALTEK